MIFMELRHISFAKKVENIVFILLALSAGTSQI